MVFFPKRVEEGTPPQHTIRLSDDLDAALLLRLQSLGYSGLPAYLRAVARQDLIDLPCHQRAQKIQAAPPLHRDEVDAELLRHVRVLTGEAGW